ncbi:MAG: hypothetical protein WBV61_08700 [Rhodanobacteraceae bacterium]
MNRTSPLFGVNGSLKRSFDDVVDAAEELLRTTVDETNTEVRTARKTLEANLRGAKAKISEQAGDVAAEVRQIGAKGEHFVRENPWASIGVGAAIGLLVGLLVRKH